MRFDPHATGISYKYSKDNLRHELLASDSKNKLVKYDKRPLNLARTPYRNTPRSLGGLPFPFALSV